MYVYIDVTLQCMCVCVCVCACVCVCVCHFVKDLYLLFLKNIRTFIIPSYHVTVFCMG